MSLFLRDYLTVVWFGVAAVLLGGLLLGIAAARPPRQPSHDKLIAYESGVDPVGIGLVAEPDPLLRVRPAVRHLRRRSGVHLPWAASIERYGTFGLVVMLAFIVLLLDGLVYAWKRGLLRWV